MFARFTLVQKVLVTVMSLFMAASIILGFVLSIQIKQAYLNEQKRNVAEFVARQAKRYLTATDFRSNNGNAVLPKFVDFQNEILTPEIVRIKIYNTQGVVIYSDQTELIGQNLFASDPPELKEILNGNVVADISNLSDPENKFEKQYKELLEIYTPIYTDGSSVIGIVETYYNLELLNGEIRKSQVYLIASVAIIFIILFALLFIIVRRASKTLIEQDDQLKKDILKEQEYSSLKDEFIEMSSHQLRTPSSAIRWSVELLKEESNKFDEAQKTAIESIRSNTESLISIINNLIIVAEIKPDYFVLEKDSYSLFDLTQKIVNDKQDKIKEKNLIIKIVPVQNLRDINLRKDAIYKVVNILIDNALDYTPSGGRIDIQIIQKEKDIVFEVKDTGIGIPESEQTKVFGKLFRATNAINQKNVGGGLSLYIAKKIIEGFLGKISFESTNKGSVFRFEINN